MKTLYLVRHAKACRSDPARPDSERPLTDRGRRDAEKMGNRLAKRDITPDLIMSSPALRAFETAEILAVPLGRAPAAIRREPRLYGAMPADILDVLHELGDAPRCVMVIGHNPELTALASALAREHVEMATCTVVEFAVEIESWLRLGKVAPARFRIRRRK